MDKKSLSERDICTKFITPATQFTPQVISNLQQNFPELSQKLARIQAYEFSIGGKALTAQEALITLYNSSRSAPLTLDQHDNNRACVDVLAQVLGIKLEWTVPVEKEAEEEVAKLDLTDTEIVTNKQANPLKNSKKGKK